jgi:hypothetical protein
MTINFQPNTKFNTEKMLVLIEDVSHANSAFGVNESGDSVFFNSRIVTKMDLEIGDEIFAQCIPNYEDKRAKVRWRCVRTQLLDD